MVLFLNLFQVHICLFFLQNPIHGGAPIAQFYSSTKLCIFHGDCQIPNMYNKTHVDILIADIYNDTCTKTEVDSTPSTYTNSIDSPNGFYSKAKMSIILDTYYNITEIQANYYDKVASDSLFSNVGLSNYYTKIEVGDIDNELSTLVLHTYTNTEVATLLFSTSSQYFSAISLIHRELGLNYLTNTQITETGYNETEVDNLITFDPNVVYTKTAINSILNSNYSTIEDRDQLFLAYSPTNQINEAYYDKAETDYLLANKVSTTGGVSIGGNVSAQQASLTSSDADHLPLVITRTGSSWFLGEYVASETNSGCLFKYKTAPGEWWTGVWGTNTHEFKIRFNYKGLSIKPTGDAALSGKLDAGQDQAQTSIKAYLNHAGSTGHIRIEGRWRDQGFLHFETNYGYGEMLLTVRSTYFILCSDYAGNPYAQTFQPLTQPSDDRLKENEVIIESAYDTLPELRPQLYDKKPDMENDDPTTWYKESGLTAQEMYYDALELRHLIHKGKPETDEEGNAIPLLEIPTSIDPKQDPDYSSWGKDPASVNYIGLIAYLVKANSELH